MPTHRSAEKRDRQNAKRRSRNRTAKSRIRTTVKRFEAASDEETRARLLKEVQSELDKAAGKGIIPATRAARKKSRLAAHLRPKDAGSAS
ncbi:hypothetical protein AMJ39_06065 [candidate division TA06 bacterium DG_24]|uniref:Small ribosomal subunit protein bS20 n=2 Tax=Bacteria division TA06 TaxID=1156500 RepID=A0A0S8GEY5_UNCT6|nr:MAG: hypothetical protein AMJ39_06065 [candidate division TA06 bacterium DG_24]KPK70413.1 MAG: hypothetical protein AMJ82_03400 [candidate division TA06 bacterium SM23_40]